MRFNNIVTFLILLLLLSAIGHMQSFCKEKVHLTFDHFYDQEELTKALKDLKKAYPEFIDLKSLDKTYQGRDIWGVIINNPKTGPEEHKPGFYIDANIHGNEIQGTEVALYTIWYLLTNYGETELATRLLDERVFYVIPSMNPDSRDHFIHKPTDPNSPRTGLIPYDDDRDGVKDEDGPDDLDGDGSYTQMRKKDPNGNYRLHPDDPRIMIPVKPGQKGEYIMLGREGIDNDGDGRINEDPIGGYDMNRNYAYNWQPNYVQRGAGGYPFCWPETKATRDFVLDHPNIAGGQNFHNTGGMILKGPGAKNLGDYPAADRRIYDYIGQQGEKILPDYEYQTVYKDLYTVYGGSIDFLYLSLGIYTFTNELDISLSSLGAPEIDRSLEENEELREIQSMYRRINEMFYYDRILLGEQYAEWKPYKHPLYGDIEIGGVKKFGRRVPPFFQLPETCHRNAAFCMYHADQLARLEFDKTEVEKTEDNVYQVDITIKNSRVTPSISNQAIQKKLHRTDRITVEGENVKLLAAGKLTDRFRDLTEKIEVDNNSFWVARGIPGFDEVDFRLLVSGRGRIKLIYDSLKGGYKEKTMYLK